MSIILVGLSKYELFTLSQIYTKAKKRNLPYENLLGSNAAASSLIHFLF